MDRFIWCLPAILGLLTAAFPPIPHGSVGVVYYSDDKIVMAADSRGSATDGKSPTDTYCKITALNNKLVFMSVGAVEYERIRLSDFVHPWNNIDEARKASNSTVFSDFPTFQTAVNWGNAIVNRWESLYLGRS